MLMHWQASAGVSFVAATHHRAAQCFRYHGNAKHGEGLKEVSLTEFQLAIKERHRIGSRSMEDQAPATGNIDFA